jgi:hypothetical protein
LVCSISFCGCEHVKGQPTRSNGQSSWPPQLAAALPAVALLLAPLAVPAVAPSLRPRGAGDVDDEDSDNEVVHNPLQK